MPAVTNITSLRDQVKKYLVRSSVADSDIDNWVALVEGRLNYGSQDDRFDTPALRAREMRYTDPAFTVDAEFEDLPDDYLAPVVVRDPGNLTKYADGTFVDLVSAPQVCGDALGRTGSFRYIVIHGKQAQFAPYPDAGQPFSLQFTYYQKIPALTEGNPTNWLVVANPGVYLTGCLLEAYLQYRNDKEATKWWGTFTGLVRGMNASEQQSLYAPGQRAYSDVMPGGYSSYVRG